MQGRRVYPEPYADGGGWPLMNAGEYGLLGETWHAETPNGHGANLAAHKVVEHEDGTITVSPSILVSTRDEHGKPKELWHGFLERGVWREV